MKVTYDRAIKIVGIGLVSWNRLGPEQWLPEYAIASLHGSDMATLPNTPPVFSLPQGLKLVPTNTADLVKVASFRDILENKLPEHAILTYKPITVPTELHHRKFLMVDPKFTSMYENKVHFRQKFSENLSFPSFVIHERSDLSPAHETYHQIMDGREAVVLQDEMLSGGKGTFIVTNEDSYKRALEGLASRSKSKRVVVSDLVPEARERSIQCCVTEQGVFTGPLQRQIIAHPDITNTAIPAADKFGGAQILLEDQDTDLHLQAQQMAQVIGKDLHNSGYRGIFGIDMLLGSDDKLYLIEINPRITGVTPLLTALYRGQEGVPFYLLHLLELGQYPYKITDTSATFDKEGSILVIHSHQNHDVILEQTPPSGTYKVENGELHLMRSSIDLNSLGTEEFVLQEYMPPGIIIKAGTRLVTLQFKQKVLDESTNLWYNNIDKVISVVRASITTRPIGN